MCMIIIIIENKGNRSSCLRPNINGNEISILGAFNCWQDCGATYEESTFDCTFLWEIANRILILLDRRWGWLTPNPFCRGGGSPQTMFMSRR